MPAGSGFLVRGSTCAGQAADLARLYGAGGGLSLIHISLVALHMDMSQLGTHTVEGKAFSYAARDYWGIYVSRLEKLLKDIYGSTPSVDQDVDVDLILAQIEMNRQLIATELAAANNAYAQGVGILQGYGS